MLGLVALGSMAQHARLDQWSDHDFWVITVIGERAGLRGAIVELATYCQVVAPLLSVLIGAMIMAMVGVSMLRKTWRCCAG